MAHPTDRAFAALPSSPTVSPVPASIPCAEPFDTARIVGMLEGIDEKLLQPIVKKAADEFYCAVMGAAQDYLQDNLDYNMAGHIKMLERENQRFRTELWDVDKALGTLSRGQGERLQAICVAHEGYRKSSAEVWRLRDELAQAIEARRAETLGSVEDKSAAPTGCAQ